METKHYTNRKDIYIVSFICIAIIGLGLAGRKNVKPTTINVGGKTLQKTDAPKYDNTKIVNSESDTINKVVKLAYSYVGVREKGCNNCGSEVMAFSKRFGNTKPQPWCTYFTCFVLDSCGIANPKGGWTPSLSTYKAAEIVYQRGKNQKPNYQKYLVFTLYYSNLKREGHSGIVVSITDKTTTTIEGNTTMAGGRETYQGKDGVREMRRPTKDIYRFIKYNEKIN